MGQSTQLWMVKCDVMERHNDWWDSPYGWLCDITGATGVVYMFYYYDYPIQWWFPLSFSPSHKPIANRQYSFIQLLRRTHKTKPITLTVRLVSICIISAELSLSSNEVHFMVPSHSYCCAGAIERSKSAKTKIVCGLVRRNVTESVGFLTKLFVFSFFECFLIHRSHHKV